MNLMDNTATRAGFVIVFALIAALLPLLGDETLIEVLISGEMMGKETLGEIGWMWIPALLMVTFGILLTWMASS